MRFTGNLTNRLAEKSTANKNTIKEGDDITLYLYSDRVCYYVTEVINQKHIFIKRYEVVASRDADQEGGLGAQNWKFFKSKKEADKYLLKHNVINELKDKYYEAEPTELEFRYGKWKRVERQDKFTNEIYSQPKYYDFGDIRFGVRDYYYDWEY